MGNSKVVSQTVLEIFVGLSEKNGLKGFKLIITVFQITVCYTNRKGIKIFYVN